MQVQKLEKGIFIGDSAAASHMTSDMTELYNLQKIPGSVMIGNEQSIRCTHKGLLDVICIQRDGLTARDMWEIKAVPQLNHDLFNFTSAMKSGWQMNGRWKNNGIEIELFKRGHDNFRFDRMIPSGSSSLMGVKVNRVFRRDPSMIEQGRKIPIQKLHYVVGHTGKHLINPTRKYLGIQTTGKYSQCEPCAIGKIRQANIPKVSKGQQEKNPGERIFIDISSMLYPSAGGKKHWLLIVDESTDYTHSFPLKKKSDMIKIMLIRIKNMFKEYHIRIKKIRLDNSGENRMLQAKSDQQNLMIKFKFTAPETPQQNSVVKINSNINGKSKSHDEPCWL